MWNSVGPNGIKTGGIFTIKEGEEEAIEEGGRIIFITHITCLLRIQILNVYFYCKRCNLS